MSPVRLLLLAAFVAAGCGRLPPSMGRLREVTVICRDWSIVQPVVESLLGRELRTPQREPEFRLKVGEYGRFRDFTQMRLLLLIGTSDDTILRQVVGSRIDSLGEGGAALFRFPAGWARNQWTLVFIARTQDDLLPGLRARAGQIRLTLHELVLEQMATATYERNLDRQKTTEFGRKYGFSLDVPRDWRVEPKFDTGRFVYFHRHDPSRSIFAYWDDTGPPLLGESLVVLRNRLGERFYDGDYIDTLTPVQADTIRFMGGPALRLIGVWQNKRLEVGGPFIEYAFRYQGRFFLLDGMVYNPGEKKLDNIAQLEAMLRTFTPR